MAADYGEVLLVWLFVFFFVHVCLMTHESLLTENEDKK